MNELPPPRLPASAPHDAVGLPSPATARPVPPAPPAEPLATDPAAAAPAIAGPGAPSEHRGADITAAAVAAAPSAVDSPRMSGRSVTMLLTGLGAAVLATVTLVAAWLLLGAGDRSAEDGVEFGVAATAPPDTVASSAAPSTSAPPSEATTVASTVATPGPETTSSASTAPPPSTVPPSTVPPSTAPSAPPTTVTEVAPDPATPTTAPADTGEVPESKAVVRNGQIFLEGAVPDAEAGAEIAELAAEILGEENVFNDYTVDPRAGDPDLGNITVEDTINFDSGSSVILPGSETLLNQGLALFTIRPSMTMVVVGHTDDRGTEEYNQRLSLERAEAVRQWFVDRDVDAARIAVDGAGESEPLVSNETADGRRRNRRIQFFLDNILG